MEIQLYKVTTLVCRQKTQCTFFYEKHYGYILSELIGLVLVES